MAKPYEIITIPDFYNDKKNTEYVEQFQKLRRTFFEDHIAMTLEQIFNPILFLAISQENNKVLGGLAASNISHIDLDTKLVNPDAYKTICFSHIVVDDGFTREGISKNLKKEAFNYLKSEKYDLAWGHIDSDINNIAAPKSAVDNKIKAVIDKSDYIYYLINKDISDIFDAFGKEIGAISVEKFLTKKIGKPF